MLNICEYNLCSGCSACMNVCSHQAIKMLPDKHGELHPVINEEKCVDCQLCRNVCPINYPIEKTEPIQCFAAWEASLGIRKLSASGGVAAAMYQTVIKELKGVVYGVGWRDDLKAHFLRVEELSQLNDLKGSKYVQAVVDTIYRQVKVDLQKDRTVLFVGTPCQVAGLKKYLRNKKFNNLITCDLLCHGVPPQDYLVEEIKSLLPKNKLQNITNCRFRGNDGYNYWLTLWNGDTLLYAKRAMLSYYLAGFLTSIILRESCYHCKYSDRGRVADITIGDFIGLGKLKSCEQNPSNVSVVTLNTDEGASFWNKVVNFSSLKYEERQIDEAVCGGGSFRNCASRNPKRNKFLSDYEQYGWRKAIRKSLWKSILKAKVQRIFKH